MDDSVKNYKIKDLVAPGQDDKAYYTIDFKRDLQPSIALGKTVIRLPDGRPDRAEYSYNSVLYAKIEFEFQVDSQGLVLVRTEKLFYVKNDDSWSPEIIIKSKAYDHSDPSDGEMVMREKVQSRHNIVDGAKSVVVGTLKNNLSISVPDIVIQIQPFWDECGVERRDFIELGATSWVSSLQVIDLNTTSHTWLSEIIPNTGTNLRDYMVSVLSY